MVDPNVGTVHFDIKKDIIRIQIECFGGWCSIQTGKTVVSTTKKVGRGITILTVRTPDSTPGPLEWSILLVSEDDKDESETSRRFRDFTDRNLLKQTICHKKKSLS